MNLDLVKQGPRQSWPRNTIDATEKVAPGSFYLVLCFSFNVLCVEEKKTRLCNSLLSQFLPKFQTKAKIFQSSNFKTLR